MTDKEATPATAGRRSVFDREPVEAELQAAKRAENRAAFDAWIEKELHDGNDYGAIHITSRNNCDLGYQRCTKIERPDHWSKSSLFKPGAERVLDYFGLIPWWPNLVSYEETAIAGEQIKQVVLRCEAVDAEGFVYAQGIGGRELEVNRAGNPDLNKTLKMAKKASLVDCALTLGKMSGRFTQDIEEMGLEESQREHQTKKQKDAPGIKVKELTLFTKELSPEKLAALIHERYGKDDLKAVSKERQLDLLEWFRAERAVRLLIPQITREDFDRVLAHHFPGRAYATLLPQDFDNLREILEAILKIQAAKDSVGYNSMLSGFEKMTHSTLFDADLVDLQKLLAALNGAIVPEKLMRRHE